MRRIAWIALGAVGGILAYRSGQRFIEDARERGLAASAQQAGASAWASAQSAASLLGSARDLAAKALIAQAAASQALAQQESSWPRAAADDAATNQRLSRGGRR